MCEGMGSSASFLASRPHTADRRSHIGALTQMHCRPKPSSSHLLSPTAIPNRLQTTHLHLGFCIIDVLKQVDVSKVDHSALQDLEKSSNLGISRVVPWLKFQSISPSISFLPWLCCQWLSAYHDPTEAAHHLQVMVAHIWVHRALPKLLEEEQYLVRNGPTMERALRCVQSLPGRHSSFLLHDNMCLSSSSVSPLLAELLTQV